MDALKRAIQHITETAKIPSFSSYEERLHPYIQSIFDNIAKARTINVPGNSLIYHIEGTGDKTLALTAHLDKINHYGADFPSALPVKTADDFIEGAMDNCAGLGLVLTLAELSQAYLFPDFLIFLSEMEESKGFKEHPERLKNGGKNYEAGRGAKRIACSCLEFNIVPDEVVTVDTTPLFKGEPGVALYSKHWELNNLEPNPELIDKTTNIVERFKSINATIKLDNNTNDYLHYGEIFNQTGEFVVPSVALEPAIFPYHQKGERVFVSDIQRVIDILKVYLTRD